MKKIILVLCLLSLSSFAIADSAADKRAFMDAYCKMKTATDKHTAAVYIYLTDADDKNNALLELAEKAEVKLGAHSTKEILDAKKLAEYRRALVMLPPEFLRKLAEATE